MRVRLHSLMAVAIIVLSGYITYGQSALEISGFCQVSISKVNGTFDVKGNLPAALGGGEKTFQETKNNYLNPGVQQMNLFLRKELAPNLTGWINFEFVNSYSSKNKWGDMNLEEAWIKYDYDPLLQIKAGILIPRFNYMNEIKNRMPMLPFVLRPLVYEASLSGIINQSSFLPERAFLQLTGAKDVSDLELNYAVFVGPSESAYINNGAAIGSAVAGTDTTNFKLFGGRLGMVYKNVRLGVSATFDKDNQQAVLKEDVKRTRLGLDFGYSLSGFSLDAEYIGVSLKSDKTTEDLDKSFFSATLTYDITEQYYAYTYYSKITDKESSFLKNGMAGVFGGLGYRPNQSLVLKVEYGQNMVKDASLPIVLSPALPVVNALGNLDYKVFSAAISILF